MMLHLKDVHGNVISDPNEMRKNALGFYMDLFGEWHCDIRWIEELHKDLLKAVKKNFRLETPMIYTSGF